MSYPSLLDRYFNESEQKFIKRTVRINAMIGATRSIAYRELINVLGYVEEQEPLLNNVIKMIYNRLENEKKYGTKS